MGTRGSIAILRNHMFAILRGANGRRHEVDFNEDPVIVDVSIGAKTIQITMTAADPGDPVKGRYVTIALPRDALTAAMATAAAHPGVNAERGLRLVDKT
jgi:hypothetical protein